MNTRSGRMSELDENNDKSSLAQSFLHENPDSYFFKLFIFLLTFCSLLFGLLYPAYGSYKAVKNKDIKLYVKWMMYWIVFALFTALETFTDIFLSFWFPFYYELKVIMVIWLLSPVTRGSSIMYRRVIHPLFLRREQEIDELISKAKDQGYNTLLDMGYKGMNLATKAIMSTAVKSSSGFLFHLKRSYSLNDLNDNDNVVNNNLKCKKLPNKWKDCQNDFQGSDQESDDDVKTLDICDDLNSKQIVSSCMSNYEYSSKFRNVSSTQIPNIKGDRIEDTDVKPFRSTRQGSRKNIAGIISQKTIPSYREPTYKYSSFYTRSLSDSSSFKSHTSTSASSPHINHRLLNTINDNPNYSSNINLINAAFLESQCNLSNIVEKKCVKTVTGPLKINDLDSGSGPFGRKCRKKRAPKPPSEDELLIPETFPTIGMQYSATDYNLPKKKADQNGDTDSVWFPAVEN